MSNKRCTSCGGEIDFDKATGIGVCQYCGTKQTLPKEEYDNLQQSSIDEQKNNEKKAKRKKMIISFTVAFIAIIAYIIYIINLIP